MQLIGRVGVFFWDLGVRLVLEQLIELAAHSFFFLTIPLTEEASKCFVQSSDVIHHPSMILQLANDLGT
ncbi:hypothetical protein Peur_053369 [Populus x canadensis]